MVIVPDPDVTIILIRTAQLLPAAKLDTARWTEPSLAAEDVVPSFVTTPQFEGVFGVNVNVVSLRVIPEGNVSTTVTVDRAPGFPAGLVSVRVSVVLPPTKIPDAPKTLVNVGGAYTSKVSEAAVPVRDTGPVAVGASGVFVRVAPVAEVAVILICAAQLLPAERLATAR